MVGIKNKVQKRKYDRGRQRNRRRKCVGSGTPLTLEDVDQIGANNLLASYTIFKNDKRLGECSRLQLCYLVSGKKPPIEIPDEGSTDVRGELLRWERAAPILLKDLLYGETTV